MVRQSAGCALIPVLMWIAVLCSVLVSVAASWLVSRKEHWFQAVRDSPPPASVIKQAAKFFVLTRGLNSHRQAEDTMESDLATLATPADLVMRVFRRNVIRMMVIVNGRETTQTDGFINQRGQGVQQYACRGRLSWPCCGRLVGCCHGPLWTRHRMLNTASLADVAYHLQADQQRVWTLHICCLDSQVALDAARCGRWKVYFGR